MRRFCNRPSKALWVRVALAKVLGCLDYAVRAAADDALRQAQGRLSGQPARCRRYGS
jgi:hypothetical protein